MKNLCYLSILTAVFLLSGCEVVRLANGKYETSLSDRGDFAAVYGDLIIIRLRNPENETGTENGYWEWGGKYEIVDGDKIMLDMDRENARNWNFYYDLRKSGSSIKVTDHRAENSYRLDHIPAVPTRQRSGTVPASDYPAYK
jgi:hypothetical protein